MKSRVLYFPTLLWLTGYIEFVAQTSLGIQSHYTLGLSLWISVGILIWDFTRNRSKFISSAVEIRDVWKASPVLFKFLCLIAFGILGLGALESRFPPHLPQEYDAVNYHMATVRQHLLMGSLSFIKWSAADLWPAPIQFGFAPMWFLAGVITKFPQFICTVWVAVLMAWLGWKRAPRTYWAFVPALALITTHGVMIQIGTAMMDLPILYFLLATISAALDGDIVWGGINLGVFASAKGFSPGQTVIIVVLSLLICAVYSRSLPLKLLKAHWRTLTVGVLVGFILLARSLVIDWREAGTPFFPFLTCKLAVPAGCQGERGEKLLASAKIMTGVKDNYGLGRGPGAFVTHLWRVSVPIDKVNNEYDYPLGLSWVFGIILLASAIYVSIKKRRADLYVILALSFWALWWVGSQQSRWLYPVIAFAWLAAVADLRLLSRNILLGMMVISAGRSFLSEFKSLRHTILRSRAEIISEQVAKLQWDPKTGNLITTPFLYVDKPLQDHAPSDPAWILR